MWAGILSLVFVGAVALLAYVFGIIIVVYTLSGLVLSSTVMVAALISC